MSEINVVPYIDVMLVLLVILMTTAPLLTQGVDVDLPQAQAESIPPSDQVPLIVSVNAQGQYFLNVAPEPVVPVLASPAVSCAKPRNASVTSSTTSAATNRPT